MSLASEKISVDSAGKTGEIMRHARKNAWEKFSQYHTLAIEIAVALIAPVLLGLWLDSRTGKEPWFMIGGMILGVAAAARSAHRVISESYRDLENKQGSSSTRESSE